MKQAVIRGAVTGAVAGLTLDISIATAGTGALAIAFVGGVIASGGNTAWRQYNSGDAIDWVDVGVDAVVGGSMNMLFGAYGRTPHRATGSSIKEIASAVSQNFKRSFSAPAGQWLPGKHARTWSLGFAEAFAASDFGGAFSGIFKQWAMFPE